MAKLVLSDLSSLINEQTAIAAINANSALIETALENTLSRDGTSPNEMESDLDMNSNRIYNLPEAEGPTEAVRKLEFDEALQALVLGQIPESALDPFLSQRIASESQAVIGTNNTRIMTPLRTKQSIASEAGVSIAAIEHTHEIEDVNELREELDTILAEVSLPTVRYETYAIMVADLLQPVNTVALVYGDVTDGDGGNGIYAWNGANWIFEADAPFFGLDARLDIIEDNLEDLTDTQKFGTIPIKSAEDSHSFDFAFKNELVQPSILEHDLSDSNNFQFAIGGAGSPGFTALPSGDNLVVTKVATGAAIGCGAVFTGDSIYPGAGMVFSFSPTEVGVAGAGRNVILAFTPTAPVLGALATTLPANAELVQWRGDVGTPLVKDSTGFGDGTLVIENTTNPLGAVWELGDELTWSITVSDTGIEADAILAVNGAAVQNFTISGLTPGWYVGPGFVAFDNGDEVEFPPSKLLAGGLDSGLSIYIDPAADPGGSGLTPSNAFDIATYQEFISTDTGRKNITINLADGDEEAYRGLTFSFNPHSWENVTIRALPGTRPTLSNMVPILAGTGAWTQPNAGAAPNVWMTPNDSHITGMIQVGRPNSCGLNDLTEIEDALYITNNYTDEFGVFQQTSLADMNLAGNRGFISWQLSGANANNIYINTYDSDDPNNYDWMVQNPDGPSAVITATLANDTTPVTMKLTVDGVYMKYVYQGFAVSRIEVDLKNCGIEMCSAGSPYQLNQVRGRVTNCWGRGFMSDCFHGSEVGFLATGTLTNGSPIVTLSSTYNANGYKEGVGISSLTTTSIPVGTFIQSIDSATQLTMTENAGVNDGVKILFIQGVPEDAPAIVFDNCYAIGSPSKLPTTPSALGGDGWSNHTNSSSFVLNNCSVTSSAARGFGAGFPKSHAYNFKGKDCVSDYASYFFFDEEDVEMEVLGGFSDTNGNGVSIIFSGATVTNPGVDTKATINVANVAFKDCDANLFTIQANSAAPGTDFMFLNVDNCTVSGNESVLLHNDGVLTVTTYTPLEYP